MCGQASNYSKLFGNGLVSSVYGTDSFKSLNSIKSVISRAYQNIKVAIEMAPQEEKDLPATYLNSETLSNLSFEEASDLLPIIFHILEPETTSNEGKEFGYIKVEDGTSPQHAIYLKEDERKDMLSLELKENKTYKFRSDLSPLELRTLLLEEMLISKMTL